MAHRGFWRELKRRNVPRAAVLYAGAMWLLAQVITQLGPVLNAPAWIARAFLIAAAIGFPFWIAFAWFYEWTPQGLKRESEIAADDSIARSTGRKLDKWIIAVLAIAVVLLLTNTFVWHKGAGPRGEIASNISSIPAKSIAVLPFENLSEDKGNVYFADGMQDLILTKLADIGDLKVISRTSTAKYQSHPDNLKIIAQQLGVATILEGSVQKAGNQVLINVQLINASSDSHIWADSYTRTLDNIFGVEGEVAQKVADALQAKLTPKETAQLATAMSGDAAANDLFLRAEYFAHQGNTTYDPTSFRRAIPIYQQALAKDPGFALARARLSFAESGAVWFGSGGNDIRRLIADAQAQAEQALVQQPRLVAAQVALGYSAYWGRGDFAKALQAFDAALALRPNDVEALGGKGFVLRRQGNFATAIAALTRALDLDPRDISLLNSLGETFSAVSRYPQAAPLFQRALDLDPENVQTKFDNSASILMSSGDAARALAAAQGKHPQLLVWRAQLLTYQRKYRQALALITSIPETPAGFNYQVGPKALVEAKLYHLVGDAAQARALFAQALAQSRARLSAMAGAPIKQAFVWNHIADAELGLGQTRAAFAAIATSQSVASRSGDRFFTPSIIVSNAQLYAEAGRADLAVPLLVKTFATNFSWISASPALLWLDPSWDPIRRDPRFQALLKKYAKYKPATANAIAPSAFHPATPVPATTNGAAHD
ncbi:MAG TPA: tetratricopeptide repeat protein [Rhodanobacteraceae bacterium]|nr:tetratricopeptide repeat protein [Rhodanobacteraceae bacterium]